MNTGDQKPEHQVAALAEFVDEGLAIPAPERPDWMPALLTTLPKA